MIRFVIFLLIVIIPLITIAQKEDYNWVFGENAGINFNDLNNPLTFKTKINSLEVASSISSKSGNLLFYLSTDGNIFPNFEYSFEILDSNNSLVQNGDSIIGLYTITNGALIIPAIEDKKKFYVFCIGPYDFINCPSNGCNNLFYSLVENISGNLVVTQKNNSVLQESLDERLAAIRHENGKDWWIIIHAYKGVSCTNKFYKLLLSDNGTQYIGEQNIGTLQCHAYSLSGELVPSLDGTKLAMAISGQGTVDLFSFNRCTGELSNYRAIDVSGVLRDPYSCEFSLQSNLLYVSGYAVDAQFSGVGGLYQYNLNATDIGSSKVALWENSNSFIGSGQLQIAPNNKIYMAVNAPDTSLFANYVAVVNSPDSLGLACDFQLYGLYLGDSARSTLSLPNMPNYNLGPSGIYTITAGLLDTIIYCQDQNSGVVLGSPQEDNVVYSWAPSFFLSDTTTAQPTASPTKDIWYYMTVRDTVSCNVERTDSVFVRVEACTGINQLSTQQYSYKIHPNLYNGNRIGQLALGKKEEGHVEVYDMRGTLFVSSSLTEGTNTLDLNILPKGVFIYKVYVNGEVKTNDKLVVIE